jgi:uncharacterized protein YdaU (DUF1376 family)
MGAMATGREAYLPLYVGDFLASTAEWDGEEQGLYLLLLSYQWSIGSLPADPNKLCRMIRWERKQFDRCWATVGPKFPEADGRLVNQRLEEHRGRVREIVAKRSAAGKSGAKGRWQTDGNCHADANAFANGNGIADATGLPIATGMPSKPNQTKPSKPRENQEGDSAARKPAPRKVGIPEGFALTPDLCAYVAAQIPDADPEALFAGFVDQAKAQAWQYADWPRAFQVYARNCKPGSGHFAAGRYPKRGGQAAWV